MNQKRTRESRAAIERLYVIMRHLFVRGGYKPYGVSGQSLVEALLTLNPEIYGTIRDEERVELRGLLYVIKRLPKGIEECRNIRLIAREGFEDAGFDVLIPEHRRRRCYRIDEDTMYIEVTRGRSDIYDILTHLTFLYIEAEKIKRRSFDAKGKKTADWTRLHAIIERAKAGKSYDEERATAYMSNLLGRTFAEVQSLLPEFEPNAQHNSLFRVVHGLGSVAMAEAEHGYDREVTFSPKLRQIVGHHIYGEQWAQKIKAFLVDHEWIERPLHIISANLHSVLNTLYGFAALELDPAHVSPVVLAEETVSDDTKQARIKAYAYEHGLHEIKDTSGTNITVQVIDTAQLHAEHPDPTLRQTKPLLLIVDYAFGEQGYECMDELLKPYQTDEATYCLDVASIFIMGKAGILEGKKGDLMVPNAHVFEGTADNYPIDNAFGGSDFEGFGLDVYEGPMITVLGTSLQNKDVLNHFKTSSWNAIGLEMEGAHFQKAIQSASRIRKSIRKDVCVGYAYYASDNPLETGNTLASGSLGKDGIKPTYLITEKILQRIMHAESVKP